MKNPPIAIPSSLLQRFLHLGICFAVFLWTAAPSYAWFFKTSWPELTKEEIALTEPRIDPEAGAEILHREITVDDSGSSRQATYFQRIKVFDQRGVELMKQVEVETPGEVRVYSVKARIMRPDGTFEELDRKAVHQQATYRSGDYQADRTSFALPGVTPGCIVDFKYTTQEDLRLNSYRLFTQVGLPTHKLRFRMCYFDRAGGTYTSFKVPEEAMKRDGWCHEVTLTDLPARTDEPFLPPFAETQPWVVFYYVDHDANARTWVEDFWKDWAKGNERIGRKEFTSWERNIREKAEELTEGIEDPNEKLSAVYAFCVGEITNIYSDRAGFSQRQRDELPEAKTAADVLKYGHGDPWTIKLLFGSLANAVGFESRFAGCSDRSFSLFSPSLADSRSLPDVLVAVRESKKEDWRFFDPGLSYLPFGQLHWTNEGATALIADRREVNFVTTPVSDSADSKLLRLASLTLHEDGELSGSVQLIYSGHLATEEKHWLDDETETRRKELIEEDLRARFPQAEISEFSISNVMDPERPLQIRFQLKVPNYADRTATRLFFEPAMFLYGEEPQFEKEERHFAIHFPFLWTEEDRIDIALPESYRIEQGTSPVGVIDEPAISHRIRLGYDPETHTVKYLRRHSVDTMVFPQDVYRSVKEIYDAMHQQDRHLLTLLRREEDEAHPDGSSQEPSESLESNVAPSNPQPEA